MRTWVEMDEWEHAVSFRNPIKRPLWKDRGGENHSFVATPRHSNPPFPSLLTAIYVSHSIGHGSRNFQINTLLNHGTVGCLSSRRTRDHGRNSSCSPIGYWGLHGERGSSGGISYVSKACYFFSPLMPTLLTLRFESWTQKRAAPASAKTRMAETMGEESFLEVRSHQKD